MINLNIFDCISMLAPSYRYLRNRTPTKFQTDHASPSFDNPTPRQTAGHISPHGLKLEFRITALKSRPHPDQKTHQPKGPDNPNH